MKDGGPPPLTVGALQVPVGTVTGRGPEIRQGTGPVIGLHSDPVRAHGNVPVTDLGASTETGPGTGPETGPGIEEQTGSEANPMIARRMVEMTGTVHVVRIATPQDAQAILLSPGAQGPHLGVNVERPQRRVHVVVVFHVHTVRTEVPVHPRAVASCDVTIVAK